MDAYEAMKNRQTTYSFSNKPLKEDVVIKLLDAGRLAPAAGGIHECEFVVVTEQPKKDELSKICLTPMINTAPFIVVVLCNPQKLRATFGDEGDVYCVENAALIIENVILYAAELGIGSAWIATVQQEEVKKLLQIPENYVVRGIIPVGYPSKEGLNSTPAMLPRLEEITHIESFNNKPA